MNIIACMKHVPDTEAQIRIRPDGLGIIESDIKFVMNPYDEYGVEEALRMKEKFGGTVTIVCVGPARAVDAIRTGLAMGADKAVHLDDPAFEGGDTVSTAKALAAAIKGVEYDLIFCGKQAIDDDSATVGSALAEVLGIPQVSIVTKVEVSEDTKKAKVHRQIVGGEEVIEVPLPAVLTAQKGLNEPRYASLPGIMKAKKKEIKSMKVADVGLEQGGVGAAGAKIRILKMYSPPARQAGKMIQGESAEETAPQLAKLLREEAKVI
jgi:electron transfer flavoprotein beta subunit